MKYEKILKKLDEQRKWIIRSLFICLVVILGFILIGYLIQEELGLLIGWLIGLVGTFVVMYLMIGHYKKEFKNSLLPLIIHKTGMDLTYDYEKGLNEDTVLSSKLFKEPDRFISEDLIAGKIRDITFRSSDVRLQQMQEFIDKKGQRSYNFIDYFAGQWFIFNYDKPFKGIVQLRETLVGLNHPCGLDVKQIEIDDMEFNDKFKIYTTNKLITLELLTPIVVDKIKRLEEKFPGKIYFSFIENQLHIAIYDSINTFEAPYLKPIDDEYVTAQLEELLILKDIVHDIQKNKKLFTA